jgi:hypothetical protein
MSKKFVCNVCEKCFNTTQHLNQHKNKKKKCEKKLVETIPVTMPDSIQMPDSQKPLFFNGPARRFATQPVILDESNNKLVSSTEDLLKSLLGSINDNNSLAGSSSSSVNSNSDISSTSLPVLVDIFVAYKNTLDINKKLENDNYILQKQLHELRGQMSCLKEKNELVEIFIEKFNIINVKSYQKNGKYNTKEGKFNYLTNQNVYIHKENEMISDLTDEYLFENSHNKIINNV